MPRKSQSSSKASKSGSRVRWKQKPFWLSVDSLRHGEKNPAPRHTRRALLLTGAAGLATAALVPRATAGEEHAASEQADDSVGLIERLTGKTPVASDRLRLVMPRTFPNGYTVPLDIEVESPMTQGDHVRYVRVVAPRNPLIEVVTLHFLPERSLPRFSTRIRLAEPQFVVAFGELNDGTLVMAKTWVEVATNGCA
jgi:sulfur-oxidizing protein SoxY